MATAHGGKDLLISMSTCARPRPSWVKTLGDQWLAEFRPTPVVPVSTGCDPEYDWLFVNCMRQSWKDYFFHSNITEGTSWTSLPTEEVGKSPRIRPSVSFSFGFLRSPVNTPWYINCTRFFPLQHRNFGMQQHFAGRSAKLCDALQSGPFRFLSDGQARMLISHATYHQISREGPLDMALRRRLGSRGALGD